MSIFTTIRGLLMRMFPIKQTQRVFSIQMPDVADIPALQRLWSDMYAGHPDFAPDGKAYRNIPAEVCYDVARLAVSEAQITVGDSHAQDIVDTLIKPNLQVMVEKALAAGGCYVRPWADASGMHIDIFRAEDVLPVAFNDGLVTGAVFIVRKTIHPSVDSTVGYTKLEYQRLDPTTKDYLVSVKCFRRQGGCDAEDLGHEVPLDSVPEWSSITPEWGVHGMSRPLFVYVRSPWQIKDSDNTAIRAAIFADAAGTIRLLTARIQELCWEFESAKRRMVVDESALPRDPNTGRTLELPGDKGLFLKMQGNTTAQGAVADMYADFSPEIRIQPYHEEIKRLCADASVACHMDSGYLEYNERTGVVTAEQVKSEDKNSYATVCNVQNLTALPAVRDMLTTIAEVADISGMHLYDQWQVIDSLSIVWGDGIMDDPDAERATAESEVQSGLRSKKSYLMEYRGLTEQEAEAELQQIKSESSINVDSSFFGG